MPALSCELTVPSESIVPNARAFVRSLNVLLKYARLYGLKHARSAGQFDSTWNELVAAVNAAGQGGLLLGASGSQLLLDGEPIESTPAERSFADLLTTAGVASICFTSRVERHQFADFVRAFMETSPKAGTLTDRLEQLFGPKRITGIRVNEIRFVAEDAGFSEARVAAHLTLKTLGADTDRMQDWFRSPEKMIQLITAAEGSHGGPGGPGVGGGAGIGTGPAGPGVGGGAGAGVGTGSGAGTGAGSGTGSGLGTGTGEGTGTGGEFAAGQGPGFGGGYPAGSSAGVSQLEEADLQSLLRLLVQFGEAQQSKNSQLDPIEWKNRLASLPQNAQVTLRQALAGIAAHTPSAKMDEATLLRLAEDLAIRFALDRFQRADVRDRQFWAAVPDSGKRTVLMSPEAWCIPPRNVQQYVEELLGRGESAAAGDILLKYAACVRNKDAEARKKAAIGLGQLAGLYSKAASQRLQDALTQIGQQMAEEKDPELQTLLSAAFVRLSQESASRRYYRAMQQALDSLAELEEQRPSWVQSIRPRIGIENRIPEFIEEALTAEVMPEGLVGVLMRVPQAAADHLGVRLARSARASERETVVELARSVGAPCVRHLKETLKNEPPAKA